METLNTELKQLRKKNDLLQFQNEWLNQIIQRLCRAKGRRAKGQMGKWRRRRQRPQQQETDEMSTVNERRVRHRITYHEQQTIYN